MCPLGTSPHAWPREIRLVRASVVGRRGRRRDVSRRTLGRAARSRPGSRARVRAARPPGHRPPSPRPARGRRGSSPRTSEREVAREPQGNRRSGWEPCGGAQPLGRTLGCGVATGSHAASVSGRRAAAAGLLIAGVLRRGTARPSPELSAQCVARRRRVSRGFARQAFRGCRRRSRRAPQGRPRGRRSA